MNDPISPEQLCRNILDQAIRERIVMFNLGEFEGTRNPQELTSGDCCGMANIVREYLSKQTITEKFGT